MFNREHMPLIHFTRRRTQMPGGRRGGLGSLTGILTLTIGLAACTGKVGAGDEQQNQGSGATGSGSTGSGGSGAGKGSGATGGTASGGSGNAASGGSGGTGNSGSGGSGNEANGGTGNVGGAKPLDLKGSPIYTRFVRLTHDQWENSVKDVLRLPANPGLASTFEPSVMGSTDFSNNEIVLTVSSSLWSSYQTASETLANQVTGSAQSLTALYSGTDKDGFITTFGRRAFRRPLTPAEITSYGAIYDRGTMATGNGTAFAKGAALVIRAMLQSPSFLYRSELGTPGSPLTGYELASKLSFWLRNTTPDDALLDAAGAGQLDTPDGAVALATQMLNDPAAAAMMHRFNGELFHFDRFRNIDKAGVDGYTTALNAELEAAAYAFFDRIYGQNLGVRDILTTTRGFVGPGLAPLYGVSAPAGGMLAEQDLGSNRVGFFTQVPFLTLYAINNNPDSIHRGLSINLDMLCADPGLPEIQLPEIPPQGAGETNRELILSITEGCGDCHESIINPIGFAFEDFDGMGRYRTTDNGEPVDTTGTYPFQEGPRSFANSAELMDIAANGKQAHQCYSKKIAGYAMQRFIVASDMPLLESMGTVSLAPGSTIKQVMLELVRNDAYRVRAAGGVQ
jgi:hypothetical protein